MKSIHTVLTKSCDGKKHNLMVIWKYIIYYYIIDMIQEHVIIL